MRNWFLCLVAILMLLALLSPGIQATAQMETGDSPPDRTTIYESPDALLELMPQSMPSGLSLEGLTENRLNGGEIGTAWDLFVINVYVGQWDLFLYKPGPGEILVRLTNDSAYEIRADLNRQRTKVVFASNRSGHYEIYTINLDGTGLAQLTNSPYKDPAYNASWSPDGKRIVYQVRYGDQYEIYTMNADGSDQARLTRHDGYDGMPSWSPDGSQILFVSNRLEGYYYVWVMNADGSNQRVLIQSKYSIYPIWSPDGSQIAFSADITKPDHPIADGWYDTGVYDVLTGEVKVIAYGYFDIAPYRGRDSIIASWSANSRYLGYSNYLYAYANGSLYLDRFFNAAFDFYVSDYPYKALVLNLLSDYIQEFDWYSLDTDPPTTRIDPVQDPSPSPYTLSWSSQDGSGSGVVAYQFQSCPGGFSSCSQGYGWEPYTQTSFTASANGGSKFFYRIRAYDAAGNFEAWKDSNRWSFTIESSPPVIVLDIPPADAPPGGLLLTWQGWDPGGSGIKAYHSSYRQLGEADWIPQDYGPVPMFFLKQFAYESDNPVYEVRVRGIDQANNASEYVQFPPVRFYQWEIDGGLHDARGVPLTGGTVNTNPAAAKLFPVTQDGHYRALLGQRPENITASWGKPGYQGLPGTTFSPYTPQRQDIYFPPADNPITDWGFEQGDLAAWTPGGSSPPQITGQYRHTGQLAVQLGQHAAPGDAQLFLDLGFNAIGAGLQVLPDQAGGQHAVWYAYGTIRYAQKPPGGVWSEPLELAATDARPLAIFAPDGRLLVVGFDNYSPGLFALWRAVDGTWSAPQTIFSGSTSNLKLLPDPTGRIQLVFWKELPLNAPWRFHRIIWLGNHWSGPEILFNGEYGLPKYHAFVNRQGHLRMVSQQGIWAKPVVYSQETGPGQWTSEEIAPSTDELNGMIEDRAGGIHVIYLYGLGSSWQNLGNVLTDAYRKPDGGWEKYFLSSPSWGPIPVHGLQQTTRGTLELVWTQQQQQGLHTQISVFSSEFSPTTGWGAPSIVAMDWGIGEKALQWSEPAGGDHLLYQQHGYGKLRSRSPAGDWGPFVDMLRDGTGASEPVAVFSPVNGQYDSYWQNPYQNQVWQLSWDNTSPEDGDSTLAQTVSIPAGMLNPTLSFMYLLSETSEGLTGLKVFVDDGEVTHQVFSEDRTAGTWRHGWADLSAWQGQTVTITFALNIAAGAPRPVAYLDEVSLGSAYPDLWVAADPPAPAVFYGQDLNLELVYGNRGTGAENARLTFQLPAGVELISATGNPLQTGGLLTWDLGSLAEGSPEQRLHLVLRVSSSAAPGDRFECTAAITTATPELEMPNNTAVVPILIRTYTYLPLLKR